MNEDRLKGEVRYSRDMGLFRAITLGLGTSVSVGVFLLLGPLMQWNGTIAPLIYLIAGLLLLPLALSLAEQAAAGGQGDLIRSPESSQHQAITYFTGWVTLGGVIVLGGLLARGIAEYVSALAMTLLGLSVDPAWLAPAVVLVLTVNSVLGTRENRWGQNVMAVMGLATLVLLSLWCWLISAREASPSPQVFLWSGAAPSVALLSGSLWGLFLVLSSKAEMRQARRDIPRALLATLAIGSVAGFIIAISIPHCVAGGALTGGSLALSDLAALLGGHALQGWVLAAGAILLYSTLKRTILTLGRVAADMSQVGFIPPKWRAAHAQFRTPYLVLAGGGVLVAVVSLHHDLVALAGLTSLAFLATSVLMSVPAVFSRADHPAGQHAFVLPFHPLIPGLAVAISLFLVAALPPSILLVGLIWFAVGAVWFIAYARRGAASAREGVTVFKSEFTARAETAYRVLVPLSNPSTAAALIRVASWLARERGGEVIALHVVSVPEQTSVAAAQRLARRQWSLLEQAVERAFSTDVSVRVIVRIAHNPVQGILDTSAEEDCNLVLMGWGGEPASQPHDIGPVIDQVVAGATCDVAVLKGEVPDHLRCLLVPTAGGPHAPAALQMGLDLSTGTPARIVLLNLVSGTPATGDREQAQARINHTLDRVDGDGRISQRIAHADDINEGILQFANDCDLMLLGASEEGLLDQVVFGGVPEDVARSSPKPVILVKRHQGLPIFWLRRAWSNLYGFFPNLNRSEQIDVYRTLRRGARPGIDFFVLITLSSVIATLGLLQGSAAVIIGAMLVAPLMTPILAISMAIARGDVHLLRLALESALKGIVLALAVAAAITLLIYAQVTPEMMARTHPTLLDMVVALASGAAGAYAVGRKGVAAALPGVAIAAALLPPLCVAGAGFTMPVSHVTGGALLLFVTNLTAITLAGTVVFLLLGFRPGSDERERQQRLWRGLAVSLALVVLVSIPLDVFLAQTIREARQRQVATEVLERESITIGAELVDVDVQRDGKDLRVTATLYARATPDRNTIRSIQSELTRAIARPVHLELVVIPVARVLAD